MSAPGGSALIGSAILSANANANTNAKGEAPFGLHRIGQNEITMLLGAGATIYMLSGLQQTHLISVLIVSLWAAIALYYFRASSHESVSGDVSMSLNNTKTKGMDDVSALRFLASNARFVDVLTSLAPLKRFDRARFRELGVMLDAFQKRYVYIMSNRASPDVGALKDAMVDVLRVVYSLYVVVPRTGKHFYSLKEGSGAYTESDGTLWETIDDAIQRLRSVLTAMVAVVVNHADETGVVIPNEVGAEPASRLFDGSTTMVSELP